MLAQPRMILAISIATGILAACFAYRILFYDSSDFWDGFIRFASCFARRRSRGIWQKGSPPPPPEYFEDESWSSGLRFFAFVVASCGSVWLAYHYLHKHFD